MSLEAAAISAYPLTKNCWLGCMAVFLAAAVLDAYSSKDASGKLQLGGLWLMRAGWLLLSFMLAYQGLHNHALPISTPAEVLLTIGWGLAALAGFMDLTFDHRLPTWAISGAIALTMVIAAQLGVSSHPLDTTGKPLIAIHVGAAILAYCVLSAQALNSAAYLLQDRALAQRKFGGIYALLPALVPLDRVGSQLLGAAVWLLGLSLVIGATDWIQRDLALVALPKLALALFAWLAGLYVTVQRRRHRLSGAAFARASLWAFLPALAALYFSLPSAR